MLRILALIFRSSMPFVLGVVIGAVAVYTFKTLGVGFQTFIEWVAVFAGILLFGSVLAWIAFRYISSRGKSQFKQVLSDIEQSPHKLIDSEYRNTNIWPLVPNMIKTGLSWLTFSGSMAIVIALITNFTLLATLAVQQIQVKRLTEQNTLLNSQ